MLSKCAEVHCAVSTFTSPAKKGLTVTMQENGNKIIIHHAKPEFIFGGRAYTVRAAGGLTAELFLRITGNDSEPRMSMLPGEVFSHPLNGDEYRVFSAAVPSETLSAGSLFTYRFEDGDGRALSCEFAVPVVAGDGTKLPPLVVTELFLRPKGLGVSAFVEVINPTDRPVDLYDYSFMVFSGEDTSGKPKCIIPLADESGREILSPGEAAVLWPLYPANHNHPSGKYTTTEGFCEAVSAELPPPLAMPLPGEIRIVPINASRYDEEKKTYVLKDGYGELPAKTEKTSLLIIPRDGGAAEALYSLVYNNDSECCRDTPVRHSSIWDIDLREPSEGRVLSHRQRSTPGRLSPGQCVPDAGAEFPVVLPLDAGGSVLASSSPLKLSFAVLGGTVCRLSVGIRGKDGKPIKIEAEKIEDRLFCVLLPDSFADRETCVEYFIKTGDAARDCTLGSLSEPLITRIIDDRGPAVISAVPSEKYAYDNTRIPRICIEFADASGVCLDESVLCVDKRNVSCEAVWEGGCVSWSPRRAMKYGTHSYEIMLKDRRGNKTYLKKEFSIVRPGELNLYRGEVHCHTADSDGIAGPEDAIKYARDVGGVDFFAVTEHSHYMDEKLYSVQKKTADRFDAPGKFAAIYGWEMTWNGASGLWGHMNILNTEWIVSDLNKYGLPEIYSMLAADRGAVAMFNHPGLAWGNFCDYSEYTPEADRAVCLTEIKNAGYDREYMNMLALGWHAAPVFNEDNHDFNWTTASGSTTFVLAPALTRDNILDAFRRRRTYSTADSTMRILYRINGEWMGSTLKNPAQLDVELTVSTESENGIGNIQLIAEDNIIVASINAGVLREFHWRLTLPAEFDYYYIKITSQGKYTVTAPVWVEDGSPLRINSLSWKRGEESDKPNIAVARVKNHSGGVMRNVTACFYITPQTGFELEKTVPYAAVTIPRIPSGKKVQIRCRLPNVPGSRRVSVVVRGREGGVRYADTAMMQLSPIRISEICAQTSDVVAADGKIIKNPFAYMRLHNVTNRDISLNNWYTRLWNKTGKPPAEDRILKLDGAVIPAGGVLTIWRNPKDSGLIAEDFNRRYGVILRENYELIVTDKDFISGSSTARRVELMCGNETISRVEYNFGSRLGKDVIIDRAMIFDNEPNLHGTSRPVRSDAEPSPAALHIKT